MSVLSIGRRLYALLDGRERRSGQWLLVVMVVKAVMDTVGVASVLPFMAVVASPDAVLDNRYLASLYRTMGFESSTPFLLFLGGSSILLLVLSNSLSVLVTYLLQRFSMRQRHLFQTHLMSSYLRLPYSSFLGLNTAEIGQNILNEVRAVIDGVLTPYLLLVARFAAAVAILILLIVVHPTLALATGLAFGATYLVIYQVVRRKLKKIGSERYEMDRIRFRSITEAYAGIKDVKIAGREQTYVDTFGKASERFSALNVAQHIIDAIPKAGLEVIAFGGIVTIVMFLLSTGGNSATVLSTVTLYAFACYRLLPAVQQMFESVTEIRFSAPALDVLERDLLKPTDSTPVFDDFVRPAPLGLREHVRLVDVNFFYPQASAPSLRDVNVLIRKNTSVALVGATGSGKTTLVDLFLGLLSPTTGQVLVDDKALTDELIRPWQSTVGYVPQQIFLSDDTVEGNIAFGVPKNQVDRAAVERAASIAQIDDVIDAMPKGYDSQIGERGIRLSGGQRQRIGIARALYHDPDVVVLDEATSALDSVTESAVFEALTALAGKKTIIVIAHRLTTVRSCDEIHVVDRGTIVSSGTYAALMRTSQLFRSLAHQSSEVDTAGTTIAIDV